MSTKSKRNAVENGRLHPVPPPGELDETYTLSVILAHSLHCVKIWRHPKSGSA